MTGFPIVWDIYRCSSRNKGITDIVSVVSLLHMIYDPSSTCTVTFKKGRKLCFDFENHEWPFQLDVGGGGGGGGGREEGDRGELALLIVQIHEMIY